MTIQNFIKKRPYLVWSTKNYKQLSDATILEAVLNYGDWDDIQKVIKILGIKKAARIFKEKLHEKRCNYLPKTKNYFKLYFNKYAR
jgi:hypothetical protein